MKIKYTQKVEVEKEIEMELPIPFYFYDQYADVICKLTEKARVCMSKSRDTSAHFWIKTHQSIEDIFKSGLDFDHQMQNQDNYREQFEYSFKRLLAANNNTFPPNDEE